MASVNNRCDKQVTTPMTLKIIYSHFFFTLPGRETSGHGCKSSIALFERSFTLQPNQNMNVAFRSPPQSMASEHPSQQAGSIPTPWSRTPATRHWHDATHERIHIYSHINVHALCKLLQRSRRSVKSMEQLIYRNKRGRRITIYSHMQAHSSCETK